jgi:hypothetical protein
LVHIIVPLFGGKKGPQGFHFILGTARNSRIIADANVPLLDFLDDLIFKQDWSISQMLSLKSLIMMNLLAPILTAKSKRTTTWKTDKSRLHGKHAPSFIVGKRTSSIFKN